MTTSGEAPDLWYRPATYAVRVQGAVNDAWIAESANLTMTIDRHRKGTVTTTLVGTFKDQANLIALITRLYDLSHTIISVKYLPAENPG